MQLNPGQKVDWKKRYDDIWPDLKNLLHEAGIRDNSIFLNEDNASFGVLRHAQDRTMDQLPKQEIMQRWRQSIAPRYGRP